MLIPTMCILCYAKGQLRSKNPQNGQIGQKIEYYFDYLNDIILMTHINDLYMISLFISLTNVLSSFTLIASTRWRWRAVKLQSLYDSE